MIYQPYPFKRCTQCQEVFLATPSIFRKHKGSENGLNAQCRTCERTYTKRYYYEHIEKRHTEGAEYRRTHREEYRERNRQYREQHPEKRKEYRDATVEQRKAWSKEYYLRNKDKKAAYANANIEKITKRRSQYAKTHPEKFRAAHHIRRARKRNLPATFTTEQEVITRQYFEGRCAICGRLPDFWHVIAIDHWIAITDPRSDNPGTVATNMIPMCHSRKGVLPNDAGCNNSKYKHDPLTWLISRYGKRKAHQIYNRIMDYFKWVAEQDKHD